MEKQPGWLNCTVSSKPESNITWYRLNPNTEKIVEDLTLGHNYLIIAFKAASKNDEGIYRCTANNDLGVVVNSETQLIVKGN